MAQSSFPFENVDTTETQFSQMFRTLNAGVNGTPAGTELKVSAGTGLQVSVALGQAMVRGHYYISTAAELLTISTANPTNPRIDTVVLRLDPVANSIVLAVVAGTAAASPVAPALTQTDAGTYEFPLANVAVAAGAGTVGTITDRRVFMGKRLQSVGTSAARDIVFPAPVQGEMVWRDDLGAMETYFGLYNSSTNPGGRDAAGWYSNDRAGGLVPIRATTATIVSGSGSANSLGVVSFTGASKVTLQNIFTSEYDNYKILISGVCSQTQPLYMRYITTAGTEETYTAYVWQLMQAAAGTINGSRQVNTSTLEVGYFYAAGSPSQNEIFITKPYSETYQTQFMADTNFGNGTEVTYQKHIGLYAGASRHIGVSLFPGNGTMTGTVQVFGYND